MKRIIRSLNSRGQNLVEFVLVFMLFLVVAFIPADFGLAFFTGQLALNASREGARIAATDRNLTAGTVSCTLPCSGEPAESVLHETAKRLSSALLPGATVTLTYPVAGGVSCNQQLAVTVTGNYNYFFLGLLGYLGVPVPPSVTITRMTEMRWEHQKVCG